jgi:lipoprotein-anchoring transpeptidase ErfK/SrfK
MKGSRFSRLAAALAMAFVAAPAVTTAQEAASSTPPLGNPVTAAPSDTILRPATSPLELRASLLTRTLEVLLGDSMLATYQVAVGSAEYPTPTGTFRIKKIVWNPRWVPPDAEWAKNRKPQAPGAAANPMRVVKIFFQEPDYYIHGTDDVGSLGAAASHGCIRMDPDDVAALARLIMANGSEPRGENWFWRVLHFRREEKTVYLDNPVLFVIVE